MNVLVSKAIITLLIFQTSALKTNYLLTDGYVASGYDVVSYFSHNPQLGNNAFIAEYEHVKFKFSSLENLKIFKSNPPKYIPKYGGWCAYAIGLNGSKVTVDPKNYRIYNNELFLFYKKNRNDTLQDWLKNEKELYQKAEYNWRKNKK
jgi:YHS domain-containing protein